MSLQEIRHKWREASKRYYLTHREKVHESHRRYYSTMNGKRHHRERARIWRRLNPDKIRAQRVVSYPKSKVQTYEWRKNNSERYRLIQSRSRKKNRWKWRESHLRHVHKRSRGLSTDFMLGNKSVGLVLHHMTPSLAVYIPEELHKSIPHNIWTGKGMAEINHHAWIYSLSLGAN